MAAPVPNTCPTINSVISSIKSSYDSNNNIGVYITSIRDYLESGWTEKVLEVLDDLEAEQNCIDSELYCLESEMEDIRDANSRLRDWGEEMEYERDKIEERYEV